MWLAHIEELLTSVYSEPQTGSPNEKCLWSNSLERRFGYLDI